VKIGELVWYRPIPNEGLTINPVNGGDPLAALVAGVNQDGTVNITVFDYKGNISNRVNVPAIKAGSGEPKRPYVEYFVNEEKVEESEPEVKRGPGRPRKVA
jgi:hypothetical protein